MAEDRESKMKSLEMALEQIQKDHGKGAIMKLRDKPIQKIASISTGSISATGVMDPKGPTCQTIFFI